MLTYTIKSEKDTVVKEFNTRRLAVDTMTALLGYTPICKPSCVDDKWLVIYEKDVAIIEGIEYNLISTDPGGDVWTGRQLIS